jgi:hypothetical protein
MSTGPAVLATRPPLTLPWQLAAPDGDLAFLLIGWSEALANQEGGIPEQFARVLADALVRVGRVTYLSSSAPPTSPNTSSRLLEPRGIASRLGSALGRAPGKFWAVTTSEPDVVSGLFDDPGFPWWLQGQLVVVSTGDSSPDLDREALLAFVDPAKSLTRGDLSSLGAVAVLRAGVDGDVAGIVSSSPGVEATVIESLQVAASEAGYAWLMLDEADFASALSDRGMATKGTA